MKPKTLSVIAAILFVCPVLAPGEDAIHPQVRKIVDEVSEDRIQAIIGKLVSFGTRNTMSAQDDPARGVGAARRWIFDQFKSYSPRLEVRYDQWRVKKQGQRIFKDVDLYNVVAVLPGKTTPEAQVWIAAHYDTLNLGAARTGASAPGEAVGDRPVQSNWEKNVELPAPGACDDGSGTAAMMELARVMSQYEFDKTLVFVAFAGEEQGLVGATLEAAKAKKDGLAIEALLNNDIIGTDVAGNGRMDNSSVNVYSDDAIDSPSVEVARFVREIGRRYMPFMRVNTVYMQDRLARGGDHTPFQQEGFAAVRVTTPNENYSDQHSEADTLANMSVPYTARVARINAAAAATLALAPKTPEILSKPRSATNGGQPPRRLPMISRGQSRYDSHLEWRAAGPEANLRGFSVVLRPTTAPYWTQEIFVGKANEYTLKGVSVDEYRFGVKAIGADGVESLVAPYVYPPRAKAVIETLP